MLLLLRFVVIVVVIVIVVGGGGGGIVVVVGARGDKENIAARIRQEGKHRRQAGMAGSE